MTSFGYEQIINPQDFAAFSICFVAVQRRWYQFRNDDVSLRTQPYIIVSDGWVENSVYSLILDLQRFLYKSMSITTKTKLAIVYRL